VIRKNANNEGLEDSFVAKKQPRQTEQRGETEAEPVFRVVFYRGDDETVPVLEWLDRLKSPEAVVKCRVSLELLRQLGHNLRRPHADALRDGIRELRARRDQVQYRTFYFFSRGSAVITHGFVKRGAKD
jgi:hypothetical protein